MCEKNYDKYQQRVIDIDSDYNLVLAPPGCGKTDILAERIVKAHQNGVEYSDMLCLTFTNRASKEMRKRIAKQTKNPVPDSLFVGNLHRFCSQFLFKQKIIPQNTGILDENDCLSIIHSIMQPNDTIDIDFNFVKYTEKQKYINVEKLQHLLYQMRHKYPKTTWLYTDDIGKTYVPFFKKVVVDNKPDIVPDSLQSIYSQPCLDIIENYIEELYNQYENGDLQSSESSEVFYNILYAFEYQKYKEENDLIDFDDMLFKTYDYLLNPSDPVHKYKWIQIDEVQDLNGLQFAIVDLLSDNQPTIVYLGDEQQAIFSFMGAKLQTMDWLKSRCKDNLFRLYKNYRSPKYLLDVFNTYATEQLDIDPELLPDTDDNPPHKPADLYCAKISSWRDNNSKIAGLAKNYSELDNEKVAILVTTNFDADDISFELDKLNVPHFKVSGNDVFSSKEMQLLIAHLSIVQNEISFTSWAKLIYRLNIISRYKKARDFMRALKDRALCPTDLLHYEESSYIQDFVSTFKEREIVLFDTETTGLDVFDDDIVQIAAIKIRNGVKVPNSDLVVYMEMHEGKSLPLEVGGGKNTMIEAMDEARKQGLVVSRSQGLQTFMDYCQNAVLIAHNIKFDYNILDNNLKRDLPIINLRNTNPDYFDTLKLIRLLKPKQKVYRLETLLTAFGLEGKNSHNAIDDVNATFGLLEFCKTEAEAICQEQVSFLQNAAIKDITQKLRAKYKDLYFEAVKKINDKQGENDTCPLLVQEMSRAYDYFIQINAIKEIRKWDHIQTYYANDLIDAKQYPYMIQQLDNYITDITTSKEADMCGGASMKENVFVSTVYKAKGLEFDNVIVANCNEGVYPFYRSVNDDQIKEDARKLYVAMSRAQKRLCLVWCVAKGAITRFIGPIGHYFAGSTSV